MHMCVCVVVCSLSFSTMFCSYPNIVQLQQGAILQCSLTEVSCPCHRTIMILSSRRSVHVAKWLALPTSDHGVVGSNPAGGEILPEPKRRFTAQSLSCSPFHRLKMTEILLKGRKTLSHPSILSSRTGRSGQTE